MRSCDSRRAINNSRVCRSFTLTEFLVAMGIVGVLGALTAVTFRSIANDAKLSSGKNTVMAVLDNARGLAMKNNQIVMVAFRPRTEGKAQFLEAVTANYAGHTAIACVGCTYTPPATCSCREVVDRFVPIPNVPARTLPTGIKIAGPFYAGDVGGNGNIDDTWLIPSHLPAMNAQTGAGEIPGEMIAVMFAPDGSTITRNAATDSTAVWIDFNNDGLQELASISIDYFSGPPPTISNTSYSGDPGVHAGYYEQVFESGEPYVRIVPFLTVFDDMEVRELYDASQWNNSINPGNAFMKRRTDYTQYITNNADRIHFNRFTGVAMK